MLRDKKHKTSGYVAASAAVVAAAATAAAALRQLVPQRN